MVRTRKNRLGVKAIAGVHDVIQTRHARYAPAERTLNPRDRNLPDYRDFCKTWFDASGLLGKHWNGETLDQSKNDSGRALDFNDRAYLEGGLTSAFARQDGNDTAARDRHDPADAREMKQVGWERYFLLARYWLRHGACFQFSKETGLVN
jgi:hypothetical protein